MTERLAPLAKRIERVALDPDAIESQGLFRVARPLLVLTGWRAKVRHAALGRLVAAMREVDGGEASVARARTALEAATAELEENVGTVERAAIVRARPPVAHASWLRRAWELLVRAERALHAGDGASLRAAARVDAVAIAPPLALRASSPGADAGDATEVPTRDEAPEAEADARVVPLQLAAIDRLLDAARDERQVLARKRRLLVAARRRLLEAAAALPLDPAGVRLRADHVAREIARVARFEHAGLRGDVGLAHQARLAVARGDPRVAYAAMAALDAGAAASGDDRVAELTGAAIARLAGDVDPRSAEARDASMQRSALDLLGTDVVTTMRDAIAAGRSAAHAREGLATTRTEQALAEDAVEHFAGDAEAEVARAAVAVDGCFEVGGPLSPTRVADYETTLREVRYPTARLQLVPARDLDDVPDAVVVDPRTLLLDLAAGRLLARRFVREETRATSRVVLRSEVRVYVLDGSGSMKGPRARVRDALIVAELATLLARLKSPGATRCTLYYRFFNDTLGPVVRVDRVDAAHAAIRDVVGVRREGGTDIQRALLASLAQVEEERELDADLARAQVVLVTDGEAAVDEAAIVAAREAIHGVPVGVSVIALGNENPALRALVARQRAKGEPAFYHYLDDDQLSAIARGALDDGLALHLPGLDAPSPVAAARALERDLGPLVDELAAIERARDAESLEALDDEAQARRETGVDDARDEGRRARAEALHRDRAALALRFARWFPEPVAGATDAMPAADAPDREDVEAVVCALASIAEVVGLTGGDAASREADAIELLERLLPDAQLTPARYRAVLREWPGAVAPALRALREACARS